MVGADCPGKKTKWGKKTLEEAKIREAPVGAQPARRQTRTQREVTTLDEQQIPDVDDSETTDTDEPTFPKPALKSQQSLSRIANGRKEELAVKTIEQVYDILEELGRLVIFLKKFCIYFV